jgi:hypothetical protein
VHNACADRRRHAYRADKTSVTRAVIDAGRSALAGSKDVAGVRGSEAAPNEAMQKSRRFAQRTRARKWWRFALKYPRPDGRAADGQGVRHPWQRM